MRLSLGCGRRLHLFLALSRSGITITGARLLGYKRIDAARLSMLMSIPTTLAAGGMETLDVIGQKSSVPLGDILLAVIIFRRRCVFGVVAYDALATACQLYAVCHLSVILGLGLLGLAYF